VPRGLLVGVGDPDYVGLPEETPDDLQPGREVPVGEAHGNSQPRESGAWGPPLGVSGAGVRLLLSHRYPGGEAGHPLDHPLLRDEGLRARSNRHLVSLIEPRGTQQNPEVDGTLIEIVSV
jgi:hypothetical protein